MSAVHKKHVSGGLSVASWSGIAGQGATVVLCLLFSYGDMNLESSLLKTGLRDGEESSQW